MDLILRKDQEQYEEIIGFIREQIIGIGDEFRGGHEPNDGGSGRDRAAATTAVKGERESCVGQSGVIDADHDNPDDDDCPVCLLAVSSKQGKGQDDKSMLIQLDCCMKYFHIACLNLCADTCLAKDMVVTCPNCRGMYKM